MTHFEATSPIGSWKFPESFHVGVHYYPPREAGFEKSGFEGRSMGGRQVKLHQVRNRDAWSGFCYLPEWN
jgi:hypothetical protein